MLLPGGKTVRRRRFRALGIWSLEFWAQGRFFRRGRWKGGVEGTPRRMRSLQVGAAGPQRAARKGRQALCWRQNDSEIVSLLVLAAATTMPTTPHWILGPCLLPCAHLSLC